jgi:hypothetical protein
MGLFSGITKSLFGGGGEDASKDAIRTLQQLQTPDIDDMKIKLEGLIQQGVITPEQAQAALVDGSAFEGITLDPNLKASQLSALAGLQDIGANGLTTGDRGDLLDIQNQENAAARGQREAILQGAQERGVGGSGLELAAQLQNAQDSATRASSRGFDVAKQAQARALEALMQSGQLAGNIRGQDMDEQSKIAAAKDQIAQFNAQNKQQVGLANVNALNNAQAQNLDEKQRVADQNVATRNQQEQYNKNLVQQDFDNRYKKAGGTATAQNNLATQQNAARQADMNLAGSLAGAGATAFSKGKANGGLIEGEPTDCDSVLTPTKPGEMVVRKEDVPEFFKKAHTDENGEFDVAGFLDSVTGHKYNYSGKGA